MCSTQPTPLSSEGRHHSKAQPVIFVSAFHSLVLEVTAQFAMDTYNSKLSHLIIMQPSALHQTISSFRISTAAAPSKLVFKCLKWTVACCLEALPCHGTAGFLTQSHTHTLATGMLTASLLSLISPFLWYFAIIFQPSTKWKTEHS